MKYEEARKWAEDILMQAEVPDAGLDAWYLLEYAIASVEKRQTGRGWYLMNRDTAMEEKTFRYYTELVRKRCTRIPLQHLTGEQEFFGYTFSVNEQVLIPRQDTEILVEEALKRAKEGMALLDMCTGSGCILLSLLHYSNDCSGVGADLSGEALEVARKNAEQLGESSALFVQGDLFAPVEGKFEIIVSNPPYICSDVIPTLMEEVREHEPMQALDGGADGLDFYRKIIQGAKEHLCGGGQLFFEIGYDQGEAVQRLMEQAGYREVECVQDFAGLDRVVFGTLW